MAKLLGSTRFSRPAPYLFHSGQLARADGGTSSAALAAGKLDASFGARHLDDLIFWQ